MSRFELGMSINYAKDWGVAEAVREFFQNALDEEKENEENKMSFYYDKENRVLSISNKNSKLSTRSLLMGSSSKRNKDNLIGEHGEGYKVATVVLMRNGVSVKIYNNEAKEVWTSKVVKSKRYEDDIVVFDISKELFSKKDNLVIELVGITEEMYQDVVDKNLHLRYDLGETMSSSSGRLLLGEKFKGNIYIEGLYVCHKDFLDWGYDFNAGLLKLDRDRGLVDSWDLQWSIASLISGTKDTDFISENIGNNDLMYVKAYLNYTNYGVEVSNKVYNKFIQENGEGSVPVSSVQEFNYYNSMGCKVIMVEPQIKEVINITHRNYLGGSVVSDIDKEFSDWFLKAVEYLPKSLGNEILDLWSRKSK